MKKINVIIKLIREKRFSKPFVQRYHEYAQYKANKRPKSSLRPVDSLPQLNRSKEDTLRVERVTDLTNQMQSLQKKIADSVNNSDIAVYQSWIEKIRYALQEVQQCGQQYA